MLDGSCPKEHHTGDEVRRPNVVGRETSLCETLDSFGVACHAIRIFTEKAQSKAAAVGRRHGRRAHALKLAQCAAGGAMGGVEAVGDVVSL